MTSSRFRSSAVQPPKNSHPKKPAVDSSKKMPAASESVSASLAAGRCSRRCRRYEREREATPQVSGSSIAAAQPHAPVGRRLQPRIAQAAAEQILHEPSVMPTPAAPKPKCQLIRWPR